ncbi:MAG: cyclase family protein [Thermoanaerobacteraceae bacterium]|nr:cyclase family protein [Thermoanaerobacteraceae bacterium]
MKIVDLSHPYKMGMTQFPGTPPIDVKQIAQIDEGGFRVTDFHSIVHVGTHCDAPAHCLKGAKTMDQIPLDEFIGHAVIVDVCVDNEKEIQPDVFKNYDIKPGDIVLLRTGYSKYWGTTKYVEDSPYLSEATAQALVDLKIKAIGMDFLSPDKVEDTTSPTHKIFMKNNVHIIENLNRLNEIDKPRVFFAAAPVLIDKADGGFTRAFAILDN